MFFSLFFCSFKWESSCSVLVESLFFRPSSAVKTRPFNGACILHHCCRFLFEKHIIKIRVFVCSLGPFFTTLDV